MILILGGAKSGKSRFVLELAKKQCKKIAYIATAPVCDKEMKRRIKLHMRSRPQNWITIERERNLLPCLKKIPRVCDGIIIECIGTYISNSMMANLSDSKILTNIKLLVKCLKAMDKKIFIVSNEVGSGIVPDSGLGRRFRDIVGTANQIIAKYCDEVYVVIAGLPMRL
ncbi:MAG: bifunctional adenosylcobinamide kinase/adenosylcobinamide-phosphate guanylyltransferase, partial [Candidatus Omnitrophica bacterium]|nr:bifunctional adenosylcobinamide kinase/adenosylcobinamide-phosphate guanylyltransferase [Candidatus Omnitrophota bacterium]